MRNKWASSAMVALLGVGGAGMAAESNNSSTTTPVPQFSGTVASPMGNVAVSSPVVTSAAMANTNQPGAMTVDLATLVADTANLQCLDYKVKGMCFWLQCVGPKCSIRTSVLVSHYNPDAIVETISGGDETPVEWLTSQFRPIFKPASKSMNHGFDVGTGVQSAYRDQNKENNFYDVNVYGNPALLVFRDMMGSMMEMVGFCKSDVMPFQPYMASVIDSEWRWGLLESVLTVWPANFSRDLSAKGSDVMGTLTGLDEKFGNIYPRIGAVRNPNRFTASMVIAQRSADIVTSDASSHLVLPLPTTVFGYKTWAPVKPIEGDSSTATWQRNYPRGRSSTCKAFPSGGNETYSYSAGTDFSPTHNYLYTLWRRYECCKKRGKFLYRINY